MKRIYYIEDYKLDKLYDSVKSFCDDPNISTELKQPILVAYKKFVESIPCKPKKRNDLINKIFEVEREVI